MLQNHNGIRIVGRRQHKENKKICPLKRSDNNPWLLALGKRHFYLTESEIITMHLSVTVMQSSKNSSAP